MVSHHDGIPTRRDFPAIECGVNVAAREKNQKNKGPSRLYLHRTRAPWPIRVGRVGQKPKVDRVALNHCGYARIR